MANPPFTYIIDDSDLQIQYSVGWRRGGRDDEFNTTTTLTSTANASFTLNFVGTSISVFGTVDGHNNSTYEIDEGGPWDFSKDTKGQRKPGILFYESPTLPLQKHKLVGTNINKKIILDYLAITSPPTPENVFSSSATLDVPSVVTGSFPGPCEGHSCVPKDNSLLWVIWYIWRGGREAHGSDAMGGVRPYDVDSSSADTLGKRSR
ncbi:hypothetical protein PC9H_002370 [Pleurotus ostreatus]|uniref:Uncharacterized protein n=1 Tax=Pleurotus ostreatus TaxID=5322 RepID=A0A8H6ZGM4_PLEOS|nr:uncharacterized protein PC9H_002370 [Pleurotus ostreatus]KAF7416110.1 hypothetical protein PC9H_002370 [Pleurotus ostreatus]